VSGMEERMDAGGCGPSWSFEPTQSRRDTPDAGDSETPNGLSLSLLPLQMSKASLYPKLETANYRNLNNIFLNNGTAVGRLAWRVGSSHANPPQRFEIKLASFHTKRIPACGK